MFGWGGGGLEGTKEVWEFTEWAPFRRGMRNGVKPFIFFLDLQNGHHLPLLPHLL